MTRVVVTTPYFDFYPHLVEEMKQKYPDVKFGPIASASTKAR